MHRLHLQSKVDRDFLEQVVEVIGDHAVRLNRHMQMLSEIAELNITVHGRIGQVRSSCRTWTTASSNMPAWRRTVGFSLQSGAGLQLVSAMLFFAGPTRVYCGVSHVISRRPRKLRDQLVSADCPCMLRDYSWCQPRYPNHARQGPLRA